tara:strand:+ start:31085 stop:34060 length:2976 start_codon:yes stop_codon:yes gene_type:complete
MGGVFKNRSRVVRQANGNVLSELRSVLHESDPARTEAWFRGRPESERKEVASHCLRWFKKVHSYRFSYPAKPRPDFDAKTSDTDAFHSALIAWFASTNAPSSLVRLGWRGVPPTEHVLSIVRDRTPDWLDSWVALVSENVLTSWALVRSLVTEGLCSTPECDGYTLGMIAHYSGFYNRTAETEVDLREDPVLFEDEIWRIFRVEGNADASLSMARGWSQALLSLVADKTLPRERVLRETLSALSRDFAQHKAGFYSRFYGMLKVEPNERLQHASAYLGLLASRVGPTQTLALGEIVSLHEEGALTAGEFLDSVSPVLTAKTKGTVLKALRLIEDFAEATPSLAEDCCRAALDGFDHSAPEVHGAIASLIESHGSREWSKFAEALEGRLEDVAASQRPRLQAWLGQEMSVDETIAPVDLESLVQRAKALSADVQQELGIDTLVQRPRERSTRPDVPWQRQRHLREAIKAIEDAESLVALLAHVVEGGASADDVERALDGMSRLPAPKSEAFAVHSGPLKKRVRGFLKKVRSFAWSEMNADLWRLTQAWLEGEYNDEKRDRLSTFAFWQRRALRIAERVSKRTSFGLLSAPTHSGGWIDSRVFVRRVREAPASELDLYDVILGLLRLSPEYRAEALGDAQALEGEVGDAVRHALGSDDEEVGKSASLWSAASRSRNPYADDAKVLAAHPSLGADAAQACRYEASIALVSRDYVDGRSIVRVLAEDTKDDGCPTLVITPSPPWVMPTEFDALPRLMHLSDSEDEHFLRWLATAWPAGRETWFARGLTALYNNMDWGGAEWQNHVYLDTLFDYGQPFGKIPRLVLAVGLTAKEPREVALATDVLIAALEDGRIIGTLLGDTMRGLCSKLHNRKYKWQPHRPKAARWAKTLGEAARVSALHAEEVRIAIEHAIAFTDPEEALKDQGALFSLLRELCVEASVAVKNTRARTFLESYSGGSKAAKLAKACLALQGEASANADAARALALEARLSQAEG